jgi:hypothetical protein
MTKYQFIDKAFLVEERANPDMIADAVKNKRVVEIAYQGDLENAPGVRTIEPSCFGKDKRGRYVIRAWQRDGATVRGINPPPITKGWKWFLVSRISNWNESSNVNFTQKRPKFNTKGDKHMSVIYAISNFAKEKPEVPGPPSKPKPPQVGVSKLRGEPVGKEYIIGQKPKTRDPKSRVLYLYPNGVSKKDKRVRIAVSKSLGRYAYQYSDKLQSALRAISKKVADKGKEMFIDLSGMTPAEIEAFSKRSIDVLESIQEQLDWFLFERTLPVIRKRVMTLTEIFNLDANDYNEEE